MWDAIFMTILYYYYGGNQSHDLACHGASVSKLNNSSGFTTLSLIKIIESAKQSAKEGEKEERTHICSLLAG